MDGLLAYLVVSMLLGLWVNRWVDRQAARQAQAKRPLPAKPEFLVEFIGHGQEIGQFKGRPIFDRILVAVHADGRPSMAALAFDGVVQPGTRVGNLLASLPVETGQVSISVINRGARYSGTFNRPSAP